MNQKRLFVLIDEHIQERVEKSSTFFVLQMVAGWQEPKLKNMVRSSWKKKKSQQILFRFVDNSTVSQFKRLICAI